MFKLEKYVTPIILNEIGKFVKDFNPGDFQMSLWQGELALQNLDICFDEIKKLLEIPIEFISGRVRELTITVPWARVTSKPIDISIDTIELVLKLKGYDDSSNKDNTSYDVTENQSELKEIVIEEPEGYIKNIVKIIVANIKVKCKNIILKILTADNAFSLNVQEILILSANQKWQSGLTNVNPFRKIVEISGISICFDRLDKDGKIMATQAPILSKTFLEIRVFRRFNSEGETSSTLKIHCFCKSLNINITSLHFPIIVDFLNNISSLTPKHADRKTVHIIENEIPDVRENNSPDTDRDQQNTNSETFGWIRYYSMRFWNIMPKIMQELNTTEIDPNTDGHYTDIGLYIEEFELILFSLEESLKKSAISPIIRIKFKGIFTEILVVKEKWVSLQSGMSYILIEPLGTFSPFPSSYFILINANSSDLYLNESLFYVPAKDCIRVEKKYLTDVENHLNKYNDFFLINKGSGLAVDIIFIPEKDNNSQISNSPERLVVRVFLSTVQVETNSSLLTVIDTIKQLILSCSPLKSTSDSVEFPNLKLHINLLQFFFDVLNN